MNEQRQLEIVQEIIDLLVEWEGVLEVGNSTHKRAIDDIHRSLRRSYDRLENSVGEQQHKQLQRWLEVVGA